MQKKNKKNKKVKIMATVGPSSFKESIIRKMDLSGIDVFRVNMSHTKIDDLKDIVSTLKTWTSKEICIDTEGAQIRTGIIKGNNIEIKSHSMIEFVPIDVKGDLNKIPVSVNPWEVLLPGDILKIDFHSAIIQIIKIDDETVLGRALEGGIIGSNKGICLDRDIKLQGFTSKDIKSFAIAKESGIKIVALSFASSAEDVIRLRKYFDEEIKVISKIESIQGIHHLESICRESDAILIDRGDLSREVPIEKISFAQRHIQKKANGFKTPVYVATNLLESMVNNCKPTRAEINDITSTLFSGVDGLVLAAESAIGKYPVESTRMIARIINEVENNFVHLDDVNYFCSLPTDRIIEPHGGELVQNFIRDFDHKNLKGLLSLEVDDEILSDIVKITEGAYSPLKGFMSYKEMTLVLEDNMLPDKIPWTMPVLLQVTGDVANELPQNGTIRIKRKVDGKHYGFIEMTENRKIPSMEQVAVKWFGTQDKKHPGVNRFFERGEFLLSGQVFLIKKPVLSASDYKLTPSQTRDIFNDLGWQNIIGFNTKSVIHKGHEYAIKEALKHFDADAIFLDLLIDEKKSGDISAETTVKFHETLSRKKYFEPCGTLFGTSNTYSYCSGPREAVFAAICLRNFGCNCFILNKDYLGVDTYYSLDDFRKLFGKIDIGMEVLIIDDMYFCSRCKTTTMDCPHDKKYAKDLNEALIIEALKKKQAIPKYILQNDLAEELQKLYHQYS